MAMFRCNDGGGAKPLTFTQKIEYSYSSGDYGVAIFVIENKWKKITATNLSNVQYAEIYDEDTGEMLSRNPSEAVDISSIKNIMLRLQSKAGAKQVSVEWTLS